VAAVKTGNAQERYNRASRTSMKLINHWRETTKRDDASLGDVLASSPDAFFKFDQILSRQDDDTLQHRWHQFNAEVTEIIPGVMAALKRGDVPGIGPFVDKSQAMAEMSLGNQIAETIALQRSARSLGAVAASAFGAGFGGSVWALVQTHRAENFLAAWREGYARTFSEAAKRAEFFLTRPGPGLSLTSGGL
jgi:galactokinase